MPKFLSPLGSACASRHRSPLGDVVPLHRFRPRRSARAICLVNAEGQPNIGSRAARWSSQSADSVDLLCAFVIWSGVVRLRDALAGVVERGGRVRVITTTYMGATQTRAVDELVAARRRGSGRVRRPHDEASREGVATRARVRAEHRLHRLVEPLAYRALRRPGVECAAVRVDAPARHRARRDRRLRAIGRPSTSSRTTRRQTAIELDQALGARSGSRMQTSSDLFHRPRRPPLSAPAADARAADARARATRPSSQSRRGSDGHRQDRRRGAGLPPALRERTARPVAALRRPPRADPRASAARRFARFSATARSGRSMAAVAFAEGGTSSR